YQLRFDFNVPPQTAHTYLLVFIWVIGLKLLCLWRFGQFDVLLGYFSLQEFSRLFRILLGANILVFAISTQLGSNYAPPRCVVLADLSFSVLALTAIRLLFRQRPTDAETSATTPPALCRRTRRGGIIGAGLVG